MKKERQYTPMSEDGIAQNTSEFIPPRITRRDFFKVAGGFGASAALMLAGCSPKDSEFAGISRQSDLQPMEPSETQIPFRLEATEVDFSASPQWFPDTRTSFIKTPAGLLLFGSAGPKGARFEGNSLSTLGNAEFVLGPDGRYEEGLGYNGYRAFSSVFEGRTPEELIGIYHEEFWPSLGDGFPFKAQIGVAISRDTGRTWDIKGPILKGDILEPNSAVVQGVGQPAALVSGSGDNREVTLYHTYWGRGNANICVAKTPLAQVDNPDSWKKWNNGQFATPGFSGQSSPVISSPDGAAALVSVSWDTKLNKFLAILERGYEANPGFYISTSTDGINWGEQQMVARFPKPHSYRENGDIWYSYPTLISETRNQFITNGEGVLLCSKGKWNERAHRGVLIPFKVG